MQPDKTSHHIFRAASGRGSRRALCALLISLAPAVVPAQDGDVPADLLERLRACRAIDSSADRLACFDRATRGLETTASALEPPESEGRARTAAAPEHAPAANGSSRPDPEPGRAPAVDSAAEANALEAEERRLAAERAKLERERAELERRRRELAESSDEARIVVEPTPGDLEAAFGADRMPEYDKPLPKEKLKELKTRIVGAAQKPTGEWVMTLANGQVWVQTQPEFYPLDLSNGPVEVVFFRNIFGGYYMRKADENARLRVKRIQ